MDDIARTIGERIRHYRKSKKLTQEELGHLASLHTSFIGEVERSEKSPTLESLIRISRALDVSLEELFSHLQPVKQSPEAQLISEIAADLKGLSAKELQSISSMIQLMMSFKRIK